jgi:hypothetical protein
MESNLRDVFFLLLCYIPVALVAVVVPNIDPSRRRRRRRRRYRYRRRKKTKLILVQMFLFLAISHTGNRQINKPKPRLKST